LVTGHTGRLLAANAALAAVTVAAYLVALQWNLGFTDYLALTSVLVSSLYSVIVAGIAIQTHRNYR
jgi:hypothetical protein